MSGDCDASGSTKEIFVHLATANIKKRNVGPLLEWLDTKTDFYKAPASTKYHLCVEGGLAKHSLDVFDRLLIEWNNESESKISKDPSYMETLAVCALFHDVCKVNYYKEDFRNVKNEKGEWESVKTYTVDDVFPYGHGEKSVYLVSKKLSLSPEESMAIRWHMGAYDDAVKGGSLCLSAVFNKYPLALLLHVADMKATYLDEK